MSKRNTHDLLLLWANFLVANAMVAFMVYWTKSAGLATMGPYVFAALLCRTIETKDLKDMAGNAVAYLERRTNKDRPLPGSDE